MEDNGTKQPRVFNIEALRKDIFQEYQARIDPLVKEEAELSAELSKLAESTPRLVEIGQAKVRLLAHQYDLKIGDGDIEGGATVRQEIEAVQANVDKLSGQAEAIYKRLQEIEKEKLAASNKALAVCYPTMQAYTFAALGAAMDILDGAVDVLADFARSTGARVSPFQHRNALRPFDAGKGKALYARIKEWFKE